MKKRMTAAITALCLLLSSCSAMLERSYTSVNAHADNPATAEDPSILRAENYRELVTAVLYLVSQGAETGTLRLYDYSGDVSADLTQACSEVATLDPLGAYAVDYIRHEYVKVVSYYEAKLDIGYRRTVEQMRSVIHVTGTGAIRTQLRDALYEAKNELVLRVGYFSGDADSITALLRQVYYDTPVIALGKPGARINIYPNSGRERLVEILLDYAIPQEELLARRDALEARARIMAEICSKLGTEEERVRTAVRELNDRVTFDPEGTSSAYDALMLGKADSEGMALCASLLCGAALGETAGSRGSCAIREGILRVPVPSQEPQVVTEETAEAGEESEETEAPPEPEPEPEPVWTEEERSWVVLSLSDGQVLYFDPARGEERLYTEEEFFALGYRWEGGPQESERALPAAGTTVAGVQTEGG